MRTDDAALGADRATAQAETMSIGRTVSDPALAALSEPRSLPGADGLPTLHGVPGHVVTDELVARHREDA